MTQHTSILRTLSHHRERQQVGEPKLFKDNKKTKDGGMASSVGCASPLQAL